ncbi:MAG: hypothetical protein ABSD74_06250 [Rhizomicrobium sp.]|jgi:hypothetical protein
MTDDQAPEDWLPDGSKGGEYAPLGVNSQIVDAVRKSTRFAFGMQDDIDLPGDPVQLKAGAAIAYDKAAQAAALGVQDATDYERNVLAISSAAQGKALAMILANQNVEQAMLGFLFALIASFVAPIVVVEVGKAQTGMLTSFPKS